MDESGGGVPGLDLLAENELDFATVFFGGEGEDGGVEGFEHFGGVLWVKSARAMGNWEESNKRARDNLRDRHSRGLGVVLEVRIGVLEEERKGEVLAYLDGVDCFWRDAS